MVVATYIRPMTEMKKKYTEIKKHSEIGESKVKEPM